MMFKPVRLAVFALFLGLGLIVFSEKTFASALTSEHFREPLQTKPDTTKLPEVKVKPSIVQDLKKILQFKAPHKRERKRVNTVLKDSSVVYQRDLEKLKSMLSAENKLVFDALLKKAEEQWKAAQPPPVKPDNETKDEPEKISPADSTLNAILAQMVPLFKPVDTDDSKKRQATLKALHQLYGGNAVVQQKINDSTAINYLLRLKTRGQVWGFHNYKSTTTDYNFKLISNFVFEALQLNSRTGIDLSNMSWQESEVLNKAKESYCKITLSVKTPSSGILNDFLRDNDAQEMFITQTLAVLKRTNATGINLDFPSLTSSNTLAFEHFAAKLARAYRDGYQYKISVTVPAYDRNHVYNLNKLNSDVDYFLVDFSNKQLKRAAPLAPILKIGNYSVNSSIELYNQLVDPGKLILCLPAHGITWTFDPKNQVTGYNIVSYKTIRKDNNSYSEATYDKDAATYRIDVKAADSIHIKRTTWFDDARSYGEKYDYALNNGLGGIAIKNLDEANGYGEFWDEIAYKYVKIDSVAKDTIYKGNIKTNTWWQKIKLRIKQYVHVLENPCDASHDTVDTTLISWATLIMFLICALLGGFCVFNIRKHGTAWKNKKPAISILIFLIIILVICAFMRLFLDESVPWFGTDIDCIDMPFRMLLAIVVTGILLGILIMRFLIQPLIQREDTP